MPVAPERSVLGIPLVIYSPDIEPGLTIKALQPFSKKIAITVEASARYFPAGKSDRDRLSHAGKSSQRGAGICAAAFQAGCRSKNPIGIRGSRGARNINMALADKLRNLLDEGLQIIHITGELDWERNLQQVGDLSDHPHYHPFAYLHDEMGLAFAAADLVICRAGASALAELPFFGLPAILVPYPYAWRYQKVNADYLADRGAAIRLNDEEMSDKLYSTVSALFNDETRLSEMRAKSRALANPDGARRLAALLLDMAGS